MANEHEKNLLVPYAKNTETQPLSKKFPLLQPLAFGVNSLAVAVYIVANGRMVSSLNPAAGGIVGPYQSVILAACLGFTLSTGLELAKPIADKDYRAAGDVEKAGIVTSFALGTLATGTMLSMKGILPLIFTAQTAEIASRFFMGASIAPIPLMIVITDSQLSFQEGQWFIPPLAGAGLVVVSLPASYLLGFLTNLDALGIGVGSALAPVVVCAAMRSLFLTKPYQKYDLYSLPEFSVFPAKLKRSIVDGLKLSIQRLTEWANLAIIADIVGASSDNALNAINPAFEYFRLFGAVFQGMGQGTGMLVTKNREQMLNAIKENIKFKAQEGYQATKRILIYSNGLGLLTAGAVNVSFYFLRKPLTAFFLGDSSPEVQELSETLLWLGMLSLVPDATRLLMIGGLRGWKDFVLPMMISLITMIMVGIPAGWGLSKLYENGMGFDSESAFMLYMRTAMVFVAATLLTLRCVQQMCLDEQKVHEIPEEAVSSESSSRVELVSEEENSISDSPFTTSHVFFTPAGKEGYFPVSAVSIEENRTSQRLTRQGDAE